LARKREAARRLLDRIGERFDVEVTGVTSKAVWVRTVEGVEGRLVRGTRGVSVGDRLSVTLIEADMARGYIDFARE
jgi:exoribonuclease-2